MRKTLHAARALALVAGPAIIVVNSVDYLQLSSLKTRGKTAIGELLETKSQNSRPRLVVSYTTESGRPYTKDFAVTMKAFDEARTAGAVKVTYLPSDPRIATLPGHMQPSMKLFRTAFGGGVTLLGLVLLGGRKFWKVREETNAAVG